jgi:hypothetical protein
MFIASVTRQRRPCQAVGCRLPTLAARVRYQVGLCGIYGEQSGTGVSFVRLLGFPLPSLASLTAPHSTVVRS